ncbi:hypothetical protein [Aquimarina aggregata]|uniref:hypothetical protein n=1 Tax=Aquimarina aggregata TaxID=1642818 RepID=UPI002490A34C|nr:hypothetical protein [Aquimarina aggregata]
MKKILLVGAGLIAGAMYFGKQKIDNVKSTASQLAFRVNRIRNLRFDNEHVFLDLDFDIVNPTQEDLSIQTGNFLTLRRVFFFSTDGELLAESLLGISNLEVPAQGKFNVRNGDFRFSQAVLRDKFNALVNAFIDPSKLVVKAEIEVLGKLYMI